MDVAGPLIALLFGYLFGSIPSGPIIGRLKSGVDLSATGSGKTGATNVYRALGWKFALVVALLDILKGFLPVLVAQAFTESALVATAAGIGAILGHNWSVFIGFKGGRGVLTTAGVFLAIIPVLVLLGIAIALSVIFITKYASLGSLVSTGSVFVMLVVSTALGAKYPGEYYVLTFFAFGLIFVRHWDNIQRLRAGTERRLGSSKGSQEAPPVRPIAQ